MPKGDDIDDLLRQATATPDADPEFTDGLRRRLLEQHRALTGRKETKMKTLSRLGIAVTAVAAAAALVVVFAPGLFGRGPIAEFGVLPPYTAPESQGVSGGPGYTFKFDYSLGGSLAAGWPDLPARATAHKLTPFDFTEAHVADLAKNVGLNTPIQREGWQDSYTLSTGLPEGPIIMAFPDGYVIYNDSRYDWSPADRAELPSDERAIQVARDWLVQTAGFVPDVTSGPGALGQATVTPELDQGSLLVVFRPAEPADVITVNPYAAVQLGRGEKIIMGQATWYPAGATSPYPLRSAAEAWETVKAGQGVLKINFNKYGPFGDAEEVRGPAVVTSVRLAWALVLGPDKTPYQVPVYVFSGTADIPSPTSPGAVPFEVWTPAVTAEYQGR